jgi:regulator of sigma E protease
MIPILITILIFFTVLAILVLVHELGHFLTAKAFGIKVLEFGVGFPPRLFAFRRGETSYSINLLPLGGFVRLLGEDDPSEPRSFASKGAGTRAIILCAGSFMNILLPLLIFTALFMIPQKIVTGNVMVREVVQDSPAHVAGLLVGDVVIEAGGRTIENARDLAYAIQLNLGTNMSWLVERSDMQKDLTLIPRLNYPQGQGPTGIMIETINAQEISRSYPPWKAIPMAGKHIIEVMVAFKNEVLRWILGKSQPQLAGPIGIAQMTGEVARSGLFPLLEFMSLLSINLAIINILPIPMLDGGKLLFVVVEWLRRGKRIAPEKERLVHGLGFALLIGAIILVSYYDLVRIFQGESLLK